MEPNVYNFGYAAAIIGLSAIVAAVSDRTYEQKLSVEYSVSTVTHAKQLVSESTQWHIAAQQDTNEALALMHASYAVACATAARQLVDDAELTRQTGVHMQELMMILNDTQQKTFQALFQSCPMIAPPDANGYSIYTGYIG